ncbi:MAG: hypothetical protein J2P45_14085, partial [Candidatus Dormibacteraeota bacterium]|nr:hypothetical protein [Candidatus Dormibacteraeota bacterium]
MIKEVVFWLRTGDQHWINAGATAQSSAGVYSIPRLTGTGSGRWNGTDAAVSVHVVWPNSSQFVD